MHHKIQDAHDAYERRSREPTAEWHPILAAEERALCVWVMVAQYGREYGTVRLIRRGDEVGYRAEDAAGQLVGYYRTLKAGCMAVHRQHLRDGTPGSYTAYWHDDLESRS
ncbi:hypothetical protein [Homoserinibacter sp. GY 40078]|uniref:hypothetical protein n=1 Tax=Homoserinibacter sp. GY 40078 TaxID=2603275 RepID=UPI0011CB571F|nr:hypothetical protein [Homoserinibacter sp. GY 40078]TXK17422.1 hypothetical protein FVQ89_11355 [Homoserinibacter sp. GY 40078]